MNRNTLLAMIGICILAVSVFAFQIQEKKNTYLLESSKLESNKENFSNNYMEEAEIEEASSGDNDVKESVSPTSPVLQVVSRDYSQANILRHVVKVECGIVGWRSSGSGVIQVDGEGETTNWKVYTNAHVIAEGFSDSGSCSVSIPTAPDYYPSISYDATIEFVSVDLYPDIDFAILDVKSDMPFFDFPYGGCDATDVTIGDKVRVYGYPGSGGDTLTVTEGIVSGSTYTSYGPIFKTSAKIDTGNSGGVAVNEDKGCTIGIPTWANMGQVEGLGFIQSWDMIYNAGAL